MNEFLLTEQMGIYGDIYFYVLACILSAITLLVGVYFWRKGIFTLNEEPSLQMIGELPASKEAGLQEPFVQDDQALEERDG